jgi:hypothetical protein
MLVGTLHAQLSEKASFASGTDQLVLAYYQSKKGYLGQLEFINIFSIFYNCNFKILHS